MLSIGIENGKAHGINLKPGIPNIANGDCAFETVIDQISTRECFNENYNTHPPSHWRQIWMTVVQNVTYHEWNGGLSRSEWDHGWEQMKKSGIAK